MTVETILVKEPPARMPAPAPDGRTDLLGMSRAELAAELAPLGIEPYRLKQLWHWLYQRGATSFATMTTLSKDIRSRLEEGYFVGRPAIAAAQESADGTRKWLLRQNDGRDIECVYIPEEARGTLCVSSQVGCTLTCAFCHTGTQKLVRNLTSGEILGQIMTAREQLGENPSPAGPAGWNPESVGRRPAGEGRAITNIVLMGMGEPLFNYDNVARAMKIALDPEGLAFSRRRITLSTAGVVPMIRRAGTELRLNLAISLHAVTDALRDRIVPINRKYPIAELIAACRDYPVLERGGRRITFEYVMLDGVNDSPAEARALVRLIAGIPAKVNLIPFNPWPGAPFGRSPPERIEAFAQIVLKAGYMAPVRTPRGEDIMAACGQLKSASERARRTLRDAASEAAVSG